MKNKWIRFCLLVIIISVGIYLFFSNPTSSIKDNIKSRASVDSRFSEKSDGQPLLVEGSLPKISTTTFNFASCTKLNEKYFSERYDWSRKHHENWISYLENGYSLDDITFAIDTLANSNFAASFRAEHLRKNSAYQVESSNLASQFLDAWQSVTDEPLIFSIQRKVPVTELENLNSKSTTEIAKILQDNKPSVDDVAFYIADKQTSDQLVIQLLSHLDSTNDIVGYGYNEILSLLDYAIHNNRSAVVTKLLELGAQPTEDAYLLSSMEWALANLNYSQHEDNISRYNAIEIFKSLEKLKAKARFTAKTYSNVTGSSLRHFYEFEQDFIEKLIDEQSIDLTSVTERFVVPTEKSQELINTLESEFSSIFEEKHKVENAFQSTKICKTEIERIDSLWQPEKSHELVLKYRNSQESVEQIEYQLVQIDPSLEFCHADSRWNNSKRPSLGGEPTNSMLFSLYKAKYSEEAIAEMDFSVLSQHQKNYIFFELLEKDINFYKNEYLQQLLTSEIEHWELQYKFLSKKNLQQLKAMGYDLKGFDSFNRSLLFYAVKRADLDLINYLIEERVPFKSTYQNEDPLHRLLSPHYLSFNNQIDSLLPMLELLMPLVSDIDDAHKTRLAVLRLRYPEVYQQLASKYPLLKINEQQAFPKSVCNEL